MCGFMIFSRMKRNAHTQYRHVYRRCEMMNLIVRTTRFGKLRGMSARAGGAGTGRAPTLDRVCAPTGLLVLRLLRVQQQIVEERLRQDPAGHEMVQPVE